MTPLLQPPDSIHLNAAEGWIGLSDYVTANEELEQISPSHRAHPDVLQVRWQVYARAEKWETCLTIATALTRKTPKRRFGWIHRAQALSMLGRVREAKEVLLVAAGKLKENSIVSFYLARYCSRLGELKEAKEWLGKAILTADTVDEVKRLRKMALEHPDFEALRQT